MRLLQPTAVDDVLDLLTRHRGLAVLVAGGCHLVPRWRAAREYPAIAIDLSQVESLNFAYVAEDELHLGPATPLSSLLDFPPLSVLAPLLSACLKRIGTPQLRNRATLAGNLFANPPGEALVALAALNARLTARRKSAHRSIAVDAYANSPARHGLRPDELITGIAVPSQPPHEPWLYRRYPLTAPLTGPDMALAVCVRRAAGGAAPPRIFLALPSVGAVELAAAAAELAQPAWDSAAVGRAVQAAKKEARAAAGPGAGAQRWVETAAAVLGQELPALAPPPPPPTPPPEPAGTADPRP